MNGLLMNLGKHAYKVYARTTDNKNYQGNEMPMWEDLTPTIQQAWMNAADAIVEVSKEGK